jgi:hypothetical protein
MDPERREPHDYRVLLAACPDLTIVGGQAVSIWAITYLNPEDLREENGYGSHDLDVYARRKAAEIAAAVPEWASEFPKMWMFDRRLLRLTAKNENGQDLIVEVLREVNGLNKEDLEAVQTISSNGVTYHALDPIAMLKAKAANVRKINQEGRQDRAHLRLIARCVSPYLRDAHSHAIAAPDMQPEFVKTVSRLFKTLSDKHTLKTILLEGIIPETLIPQEFANSPVEKVRTTYGHQFPRLCEIVRQITASR